MWVQWSSFLACFNRILSFRSGDELPPELDRVEFSHDVASSPPRCIMSLEKFSTQIIITLGIKNVEKIKRPVVDGVASGAIIERSRRVSTSSLENASDVVSSSAAHRPRIRVRSMNTLSDTGSNVSSQLTVERMRLSTVDTADALEAATSSTNAFVRSRKRISTSEQQILLRAAEMLQSAIVSEVQVASLSAADEEEEEAIMMQKWVEESHRERKETVRAAARLRKMQMEQDDGAGNSVAMDIAGQPKVAVSHIRAATELGRLRNLKARRTRSQRSILSRDASPRGRHRRRFRQMGGSIMHLAAAGAAARS